MFAPLCYPPAGSEAIVTCKLLVAMVDAGWYVDVVTQSDYGQYYPSGPDDTWRAIVPSIHGVAGLDEAGLFSRLGQPQRLKYSGAMRTLSWCVKALIMGLRLASRTDYDLVLSRAAPQYGHLPALFFTVFRRVPWIANWSDPIPQKKAPPPYGGGSSAPIPWYMNLYLKLVGRRADGHTFPCERLRRYFCSYLHECEQKSVVIPHVALSALRTVPLGVGREFLLVYAGSLSYRTPRALFHGIRIFLDRQGGGAPLRLKFIALESESNGVMDVAREYGLEALVTIEASRSYDATQQLIAEATALVLIEADCAEGIFFPSKFVDFVQTGRPILALSPKEGTVHDILFHHGGGIAVSARDPGEIADAIDVLHAAWVGGFIDRQFGSGGLFSLFGERYVIEQYAALIRRIRIAKAS